LIGVMAMIKTIRNHSHDIRRIYISMTLLDPDIMFAGFQLKLKQQGKLL